MNSSLPPQHPSRRRPRSHAATSSHWGRKAAYILLLIVIGRLAMLGYDYWQAGQELERARAQEQQLLYEQQLLKEEEARYQDPQQIEKEAREQLGLVKEDEVPYVR